MWRPIIHSFIFIVIILSSAKLLKRKLRVCHNCDDNVVGQAAGADGINDDDAAVGNDDENNNADDADDSVFGNNDDNNNAAGQNASNDDAKDKTDGKGSFISYVIL